MTDTITTQVAQSPASVALQTAMTVMENAAPVLITAAGAAGAANPQVAAALQIAQIIIPLVQSAQQLASVNAMTSAELDALYASIGKQLDADHAAWAASGK